MKLIAAKTPSPFRGTLNKSNKVYLTILSIIIATLWNTHSVTTAPAKTDPIVVALPNETGSSTSSASSSSETTSVDVESVPLVEVKTEATGVSPEFKTLPDYILEFNDPDIGGPVEYTPSFDNRGLSVIAWDLLPPLEDEPEVDANNKAFSQKNQVSLTTGHNVNGYSSQESSQSTFTSRFGSTTTTTTTTTPRTTTTTTRRTTTPRPTTTTTRRTTTTPRTTTTTTRRSTTPRTTTTTTPRTTTTTEAPDSSEFYKLENGDSYTLPSWLEDIDDPDLDVAVAYNIPEDINEYNHTIDRNILPPLEPYTDLNNIKLTPPTTIKEYTTTTTPRTTTTWRTTTTRTTTKTPNYTTRQPNWIRAKPTVAKTTIASFNKQLTSLTPTISSFSIAQRTTGTTTSTTTTPTSTTTPTTTTTVKPKTTVNYYNQQYFTSTTPRTDKIGSSQEVTFNANPKNPFLPAFNDGKYRPKVTTPRTTTTTTTKAPEIIEKNPFEPTLPPWLKDFDYPDVGPGVPFVYDPNEDESVVDENILPPSQNFDADSNANNNQASLTSSSFSSSASAKIPFSNSQTPQGFTTKFTSSASTSLTSSSSIPSIVTLPLPSTQTATSNQDVTQPPLVFVPPTSLPNSEEGLSKTSSSSTIFIKNIPAPFEPASTASSDGQKKPLGADRESFPPFNNAISGSSFSTTLPTKTTFTKSEDGKVITNNIFLSGSFGTTTPRSFVATQSQEKDNSNTATFSGSSVFKQIATTSAAASGFTTASSSSGSTFGSNDSKYTGRFGGPPGVLAPGSGVGFSATSSTVTKSYNKPAVTAGSSINKDKFTGSFGGPPGVLKPYDNVKNR